MAAQPANLPTRHRLTVSDYHRMGETGILRPENRTELIEGDVIDMAPIGSRHAGTLFQLTERLRAAVGSHAYVFVQSPVVLGDRSEPEPDLVLLKPREDLYKSAHPGPAEVFLIVDVANTTLRTDRDIKIPLYARHGIPEVWLVDLENRLLHVYRAPTADGYRETETLDKPGMIAPRLLPECGVDLSGLF